MPHRKHNGHKKVRQGEQGIVHYDSDRHGVPRVSRDSRRDRWQTWSIFEGGSGYNDIYKRKRFGGPGF